jgi:3-oxoadipate enol-lactonase
VISHGGALDHSTFRPLAETLSDRWRVILWDLPGHGQSQPRPKNFSADVCAEAMAAVMDDAQATNAVVLGFSFGGVVSQVLAEKRPDLVHRLIAYGCLSPHVGRPILPKTVVWPTVQGLFGLMPWKGIQGRFAELCCASPEGRDRVMTDMAPVGKAGFLAMARANLEARSSNPAFRILGGVDLIAGERDSNGDAIWRTFKAFEEAYPGARRVIIPEAGHCAHQDQPELFEAALRNLLQPDDTRA